MQEKWEKFIGKSKIMTLVIAVVSLGIILSSVSTISWEENEFDVNEDGCCDLLDLDMIAANHGKTGGPCDVNNDGVVDSADLELVESHCSLDGGTSDAGNKGTTDVSIVPSSQTVGPGETFTVDVNCTPDQDIRAFQFSLSFDASLLQVNNVTNVGEIFTDQGKLIFSSNGTINNTIGNITYVWSAINGSYFVNTPGRFATISFTAQTQTGTSDLDLYDVKVTNLTHYVPTNVYDGTAQVDADEPVYSWVSHPTGGTTGESVLADITVTDNVLVTGYTITIDSAVPVDMAKSGNSYTYTINIPSGSTASIVYSCNFTDAVGNYNDTGDTTISVSDNDVPDITDNTAGSTAYTGDSFTFNATVTDNIDTPSVYVEYWYGSGGHTNVSMTGTGVGDYFEKSITVADTTDVLYYIISASDTVPNWDNTGTRDVGAVVDNDNPTLVDDTSDSVGTTGDMYHWFVNASDNVDPESGLTVKVDWSHDGTSENASMSWDTDHWEYSHALDDSTSTMSYSIYIADTSGNSIFVTGSQSPVYVYEANILYVDDDYTSSTPGWHVDKFDNIPDAIDNATSGYTIYVYDGIYEATSPASIVITMDDLSLIGESRDGTIINASTWGTSGASWPKGIHVYANNTTIKNFTVQGFTGDQVSTGGYGILFRNYAHDTQGEGYIFYHGGTVENVKSQNNHYPMYALVHRHLTVNNSLIQNNLGDGMFIARGCDNATITYNTVLNCNNHGIWVGKCWSSPTLPSHNATISHNYVDGNWESGISFVGSDTALIAHNTITNIGNWSFPWGPWSVGALSIKDGCSNVVAEYNTIYENKIINTTYDWGNGVGIDGSSSNIMLRYNDIYDNDGDGIMVKGTPTGFQCNYNNIYDNAEFGFNASTLTSNADARCNWWGSINGPTHSSNTFNVGSQGDSVSDNVDFCGWLNVAYPGGTCWGPVENIDTSELFCSIQAAIDDPLTFDGHTIVVDDGTYTITGKILVHKGVTITGNVAHPENVVIQYSSLTNSLIFDMRASNAVIEGFKTTNGKSGFWFDQSGVTGCTISNCIIDNVCEYGIYMKNGGSGHTIDSCTISNTGRTSAGAPAILIENSLNVTVNGNTLNSISDKGIYVRVCSASSAAERVEVTGNIISGCAYPCIQVYQSPYTIVDGNTISSTADKGINIMGLNANSAAERVELTNNIISGCPCGGILVTHDRYTYIHGNTVGPTGDKGITIGNGENINNAAERIEVSGNTVTGTKWQGIQVAYEVPYTYIYDNTLTGCNYYGGDGTGDFDYASIHVAENCDNTTVDSNDVSDGINGIQIWSNDCEVANNEIYNMGMTYADTKVTGDGTYYNSGIIIGTNWLTNNFKPTGTTVTCNNIYDNYWGLYVRDYATLSLGDPSVLSVTAECNWWGAISGPYYSSNPGGTGDNVSGYVDFRPWLTAFDGICDTTDPAISSVVLTSSDPLDTDSTFGWVNITCTVTDAVGVDYVNLVITKPDSSTTTVSMNQIGTSNNYYYNTSTDFSDVGNYSYYISTEDISGNMKTSSSDDFAMPPNYEIYVDGKINIMDINCVALKFGTFHAAGSIREDVDNSGGMIDIMDLQTVAYYFGTTWYT